METSSEFAMQNAPSVKKEKISYFPVVLSTLVVVVFLLLLAVGVLVLKVNELQSTIQTQEKASQDQRMNTSTTQEEVSQKIITQPTQEAEMTSIPKDINNDGSNLNVFTGKNFSYSFSYPPFFSYEHPDLNQPDYTVFKSQNLSARQGDIESFSVHVQRGSLSQYLFDQTPTGNLSKFGMNGNYLELPNGYADGEATKTVPLLAVEVLRAGVVYRFDFFGIKSIENPAAMAILQSLKTE